MTPQTRGSSAGQTRRTGEQNRGGWGGARPWGAQSTGDGVPPLQGGPVLDTCHAAPGLFLAVLHGHLGFAETVGLRRVSSPGTCVSAGRFMFS